MEGEGEIPLPEGGAGGSMTKIIAAIVVIIVVVAAIAGALLLVGGEPENKLPSASASVSDNLITLGDSVVFNGSASSDPDGGIEEYIWHFGDGETETTTQPTVSYTYPYPGKYIAALTVKDDKGATSTSWDTLMNIEVLVEDVEEITNQTKPIAFVAPSEQVVETGSQVDFDANSSMAYSVEPTYVAPIIDGQGNYIGWDPVHNFTGYIVEWEPTGEDTVIVSWIQYTDEEGWITGWEPVISPEAVSWDGDLGAAYINVLTWYFGDGAEPVTGTLDEAALQNHTFEGDGDIYGAYLEVLSVHGAKQRYYTTIVVLPVEAEVPIAVKNPDVFVMATIGEPDSLDPAIDYETAGGEILQNVYETLIWYDGNRTDRLVPLLATEVPTLENGLITPDGLNYTFNLREGVLFHDGNEMTAYDVEYSLERVLIINDPTGPSWMLGQVMIPDYPGAGEELDMDDINASITVNDELNLTIHLVKPYQPFIYVLAYTVASVISMDFVEAHGGVVPLEQNTYLTRHTCGTGPFKLVEWVSNSHILMQRNDNYWREPAQLKYVLIKKVNDVGTREMLLFAGDADSVYIPRQHKDDVVGKPGLRIVEGLPTFNIDFIGLNQNITPGLEVGVPPDFFEDVNIRKAFAHAFDYDLFIVDVLDGTAIRPNGPIPYGMFGYDPDVPLYEHNLSLAASFLNESDNPDAPGQTYGQTGFELTLYYNQGNLVREAACMILEKNLEQLTSLHLIEGTISVEAQAMDWPAFLDAFYGKQLPAFFLGWAPDYVDPDDYVDPFLHEAGAFPYFLSIENETITQWIMDAKHALDPDVRASIYSNISMACYENAYYIFTAQATNFHVERSWVTGYYFNPMYAGLYYYVLGKG